MAKSDAVWGIDIGQCSLKAIRCRASEAPGKMVADAFDYIAYPKILSQPGADPVELVQEALKQFLSRNIVKGDRVAISVPGQNGLARFIKLPPVEAKKIPDIVKYEAKQQIPFDLDDVVWDYQRMGGGSEAEGFILETEVGLFAMKRDQVFRSLEPFNEVGIEVDFVQLTPLALYNYLLFDQMTNLPPVEEYLPDEPPPSAVILSLGTDATDLVITNGFRVWQRSIPLGGNHFTKALTKDLKLTFAKAEHLKCNAAKTKDPKRLFQAMRPVFNDLLTEIQRSIGYYTSIDRHAKLEKMVGLGNAMKMPGLRRYLAQSLDMEVIRVDKFNNLTGNEVLASSTFRRNTPSFGVSYGLAVQALGIGQGTLRTNLLPREIVKDRFIREKKPWTVACLALILLGCTIAFASQASALKTVSKERFGSVESSASSVKSTENTFKGDLDDAKNRFDITDKMGKHLLGNVDNRVLWPEMLRAVNECLPRNPKGVRPPVKEYYKRNELMITSIECQKVPNLGIWFRAVKKKYRPLEEETAATAANNPDDTYQEEDSTSNSDTAGTSGSLGNGVSGPSGSGWIFQLTGYHYHNTKNATPGMGAQFVRDTLIQNLEEHEVLLPVIKKGMKDEKGNEITQELVPLKELGIGYPVLIESSPLRDYPVTDPTSLDDDPNDAVSGAVVKVKKEKEFMLKRCNFTVQFVWIPTAPNERLKQRELAEKAKAAAQSATDADSADEDY